VKRPISAAAACCLTLAAPALAVLTAAPTSAAGSVLLTAVDAAVTQDFDTLAATGAGHTTLPEGWWLAESGTNANGAYVAGTGSSTSGDTYSFGTGADRALGTLQSGSLVPMIGASFTNGTDEVVTSLDVSLSGEQWRLGSVTRTGDPADRLDAQVSTDATDLTSGTWTPVDALDVTSPVTTGTVGALDGNAAASRRAVTGSVTGLAVEPGETVWLRWTDLNVSSSDDGLALDDVTVTPRAGEVEPPPPTPVCGDPATPLHEVQGSGDATPLTGEVQVEAVVVGDVQTGGLSGFFLQEEDDDADQDPATSEGVFVFAPGATDVALGDLVRLTGSPTEFSGLTELEDVRDVQVCATGRLADAGVSELALPAGGAERESLEAMRVRTSQRLTVTEVYGLGRYGEVALASGGRLVQPTSVAEPGAEAQAVQAANDRRRIVLDDGSTRQNPDPTAYPQGGLSAQNTLRVGDSTDDLAGVLDHRFGSWRVQPAGGSVIAFEATNPRPAAPAPVGGDVRVASFNVLNYFNGQPQGDFSDPDNRGAQNQAELDRQTAKEVAAITALDADVVGLMELENDPTGTGGAPAVQELVDALNRDGTAGTYAFVDTGVIGTDAIRVGLLYRPARVQPVGEHAVLDSSVDARFVDTLNRPSLAQTFAKAGDPDGDRVTVVVNHLKSKGSDCDAVGDPDTGDGSGNCNRTRTAAAEALADWVATDPTDSGDPDALVIGDLNAYAQEDPVDALRAAGLVDQVAAFVGEAAYSYVFEGQSGYLDHALSTPGLDVTGVTEWHVNADEPVVLDYNLEFKSAGQQSSYFAPDAYRSSDHDPVLVGLELDDAPVVDAGGPYRVKVNRSVTLTATGSDADGDELTFAWDLDGDGTFETAGRQVVHDVHGLKKGLWTVTVRVSDGTTSRTDTAVVEVAAR
jgi:predicted extracellular nuclease